MTHSVKTWSILETSETAYSVANRMMQHMKSHGYRVHCMTQGFRAEFNGVPVLELSTGKMHKGNPFYHGSGMYELKEYAVIESIGKQVRLGDYYGPAGVRWSGNARTLLEEAFTSKEVEEKEVPRERPR
jgi:hypothetical protein